MRTTIRTRLASAVRNLVDQSRRDQAAESKPLTEEHARLKAAQRAERARLAEAQKTRADEEARARAARFRKGFGAVIDYVTGRAQSLRLENEVQAREAGLRDHDQREALVRAQLRDRAALEVRIAALRARQSQARMDIARRLSAVWKALNRAPNTPTLDQDRTSQRRVHRKSYPGLSL